MVTDTISISALRTRAMDLRNQADEIDSRVDAIVRLMEQLEGAGQSATVSRADVPPVNGTRVNKGKPPGTLSMKWRENFARVYDVAGVEPFPVGLIQDVLKERDGKEPRASQVQRLFKSYLEHGYVEQPDAKTYRVTPKLIKLIEVSRSHFAERASDENEPPEEPSIEDLLGGSETAHHAQDGGPQE